MSSKRLFAFFLSKLWPDQSQKCYIFCMKHFVSVLFLFTGPTRVHWLQFKTKKKKRKKVVPNIWCHLEKKWKIYDDLSSDAHRIQSLQIYAILEIPWKSSGNDLSVHALPNFHMSYLHGENCNWKEKVTKKSKRIVIP